MTRKQKDLSPFKIGDEVIRKFDGRRLTVRWISKGANDDRREQLIATEENSYTHTTSPAILFERAE